MVNPSGSDPQTHAIGFVDSTWRDIRVAAAFLTRLPVSPPTPVRAAHPPMGGGAEAAAEGGALDAEGPAAIARAAGMFPLIGVGIGIVAAIAMLLADKVGLHPLACALVAIGAQAAITGALHEDGLADLADGLGGGADAPTRLAIMQDSRIGTYGALALILSVGLKATLLSQLPSIEVAAAALVTAATISRGALPAVMRWLPPARPEGLVFAIGRPAPPAVTTAIAISLIVALIGLGLGLGIAACAVAAGGAVAVAIVGQRTLGGLTGDVLGAIQQKAELLVLVVVAAAS